MESNRKAQVSIEFVMTYGWAILVILVVLIVAWQWGLFNLGGTVKPGFSGFWGVVPMDFKYTSGGDFELSLSNSVGADVNVTSIEIAIESNEYVDNDIIPISAGNRSLSKTPGLPVNNIGSNYEIFISINYTDDRTGSDIYRSSGRIWGFVEI